MSKSLADHVLDRLARALYTAGVVCTLALPAYLQHTAQPELGRALAPVEAGKPVNLPHWQPHMAEDFPGCHRTPRGIAHHALVVTLRGELRTMSYEHLNTITDRDGQVWVVGHCTN